MCGQHAKMADRILKYFALTHSQAFLSKSIINYAHYPPIRTQEKAELVNTEDFNHNIN